jgi:hypothetical protein
MKSTPHVASALIFTLGLVAGTAPRARAEEDSSSASASRLHAEATFTATQHNVWSAYFGGDYGFGGPNFNWGEGYGQLRLQADVAPWLQLGAGGVAMGTLGRDYSGLEDQGDGLLDQAWAKLDRPGGVPAALTVGRQEIVFGDGFLLGDGFMDRKAASWNMPLRAFDAVRADVGLDSLNVTLIATRMHSRFFQYVYDPADSTGFGLLEPRGEMYGGDAQFGVTAGTNVGATLLWRADTGPSNVDAHVVSLRGHTRRGPLGLAGEWALERGQSHDTGLYASAWHADARYEIPARLSPYFEASYAFFSGDNPDTPETEEYFPWNFDWTDWSKYYIGDYVTSMLLNADSRIWRLEAGCQPSEQLTLRALAHHFDLDTGSFVLGLPAGVSRHFADEVDVVADYQATESVGFWVLGSWAAPGDAAKYAWGDKTAWQLFFAATYEFEN